ncbi:MAG: hypothetical protein KI790_18565, partial [Cyclobacteriaceae bacterium]|nr:hypothetical protein [Cyclobacteriaceae bacterium HetDA_MAG_MS6]
YIAGTIAFLDVYGWWIFLIAALAGYAHSAKSGIYDFYKSEYLYYILHGSDNRIPLKKDLKAKKSGTAFERVANLIYFDYCRKLLRMTSRSDEDRKRMENLSLAAETKEAFQSEYRKLNGPLMFWWALICGTNTHRTLIMALSIAGRFDIYLIIAIVTYIPVLFIEKAQKRNDQKLLNSVTLA